MFLKLFKSSQPAIIFLVPLIGGLLWINSFLWPVPIPEIPFPMPLYAFVSGLINTHLWLSQLTALSFLILTAFLFARINTQFILLPARTYLPGIIFLIISSLYPGMRYFHPAVPAVLCIMLAIGRMFNSFKQDGLSYAFFESALLISVGSMFYAKAGLYLVVVWAGLVYLRSFRWREWIMSILGMILPYLLLIAWYYIDGQDLSQLWDSISQNLIPDAEYQYFIYPYSIFLLSLVIVTLLASFRMMNMYQGLKVLVRQFSKVFFWLFLVTLILFSLVYTGSPGLILFMSIPLAFVMSSYFFSLRSKLVGEVIFMLLLASFIAVQIL